MRQDKILGSKTCLVHDDIQLEQVLQQAVISYCSATMMSFELLKQHESRLNYYCRLIYVSSGRVDVVFKRQKVTLEQGSAYLLSPYVSASFQDQRGVNILDVSFQLSTPAELAIMLLNGDISQIAASQVDELTPLFYRALDGFATKASVASNQQQQTLIKQMLVPYFSQLQGVKCPSAALRYQTILQVAHHITDNMSNPPSIGDLTRVSGLNIEPPHFARKFRTALNISPKQYIQHKRIAYALQLLLQGHDVETVSDDCGFFNERGFAKAFTFDTGMSPQTFIEDFVVKFEHNAQPQFTDPNNRVQAVA
ncbi:hypothetical protein C2869_04320 [Saccharobesus litoralis]|uniref:HTH araC/xylS-type domain-containing protein n=1 Tax=Saccharobesus litoralis TaxID=2172099 RepID=A0A2S0VNA5_9ALTE|nr:helix-turn-helix domain-containing protein [Saccharobesus litoralis]AWB65711.1 hypothetical protein C2869_04320 [Saccharobesus litoralis]